MGDTNIKIDYQKVTDMVQSANGVICRATFYE